MSSERAQELYDQIDGPRPEIVLFDQLGEPLPKSWLIDGVLEAGEFVAVYGEPESGKGNFVLDLAAHVAAGRSWRGRKVERSGVLYVALERREQVARRVQAFVKHHAMPTGFLDFNFALSSEKIDLRSFANGYKRISLAPIAVRHCKRNAAVEPPFEILLFRFRSVSLMSSPFSNSANCA